MCVWRSVLVCVCVLIGCIIKDVCVVPCVVCGTKDAVFLWWYRVGVVYVAQNQASYTLAAPRPTFLLSPLLRLHWTAQRYVHRKKTRRNLVIFSKKWENFSK